MKRKKQTYTGYGTLIVPGLAVKLPWGKTATTNVVDVVTSGEHTPYSRGRLPAAVGKHRFYDGGLAYLLRSDGKVTYKYAVKINGHYFLRGC